MWREEKMLDQIDDSFRNKMSKYMWWSKLRVLLEYSFIPVIEETSSSLWLRDFYRHLTSSSMYLITHLHLKFGSVDRVLYKIVVMGDDGGKEKWPKNRQEWRVSNTPTRTRLVSDVITLFSSSWLGKRVRV